MDYANKTKAMVQQIINEMQNEGIKYLTNLAFSRVAEQFWHAPASSTGKYHPLYACGEAGLARHTLASVHFCQRAFIADPTITRNERDLVLAAMLLHDTCKLGTDFKERYTIFEHPLMVQTLLTPEDLPNFELQQLWTAINVLIASHMGIWNTPTARDMQYNRERIIRNVSKVRQLPYNIASMPDNEAVQYLSLPVPSSKLEHIVAQSDFTAADKECMLTLFEDMSEAWANISRD